MRTVFLQRILFQQLANAYVIAEAYKDMKALAIRKQETLALHNESIPRFPLRLNRDSPKRPHSLYWALQALTRSDLEYLAVNLFGRQKSRWKTLMVEGLMIYALDTNRIEPHGRGCFLVWVDPEGVVKVPIYRRISHE